MTITFTARVAMVITDNEDSSKDVSIMLKVLESNGFKFAELMPKKPDEIAEVTITIRRNDETDMLDF